MPTVSELIHSSFRLIGAIAAGELLEANELDDAFVSLNQMISSWNTEGASIVGRVRLLVPTVGTNYYQLNTRPVKIEAASMAIVGMDWPLEIVDAAGWAAVKEQSMVSVEIKKLYCDYGFPASAVWIWPTPRTGGTLTLWIYQVMAQFASLDQVIDLPPGYEIAVRYNFAIALLPEYPRSQVDPTLPAQAQAYKASIVQLNAQNHMRSQAAVQQAVAQ